jgi:arylsulfatase A-like enzyme
MPPSVWIQNDRAVEAPTQETPGDIGYGGSRGRFYRGGAISPAFQIDEVLPTITGKAVDFLKRQTAAKPFFLYVPLTAPHTPWAPKSEFRNKSQAALYGDFVAQVDDSAGKIIAALDQSGLGRNTLVLFASDNGAYWGAQDIADTGHRANAHWRGMKADIYEAGHRVPFLARWTGSITPGAVSDQLACLTDITATAAELAGAPLLRDSAEDSFSLAPALLNRKPATPLRDSVVVHSSQGMFGIRKGPWKLALGRGSGGFTKPVSIEVKPGDPEGELYNLADDSAETRNLYLENPGKVKELSALLQQIQSSGRSRPAVTR